MDALTEEINRLWRKAGRPGARVIAQNADQAISHSTIHGLINGQSATPRWETVRLVACALGCTKDELKHIEELWQAPQERREASVRSMQSKVDSAAPAVSDLATAIQSLAASINNLADAIRQRV